MKARIRQRWIQCLTCILLCAIGTQVGAEPYISVRSGLACGTCHTNPTGGGQRTVFGTVYGQSELTALGASEGEVWSGAVAPHLALGGDARVSARQFDTDDVDDELAFDVDRVSLYASVDPHERMTLYVDQQVAPGGAVNREAWIRLNFAELYIKAGRLFVPLGWRLEDDSALVRQATGVSMAQGDDGVELGFVRGPFNAQLAVTNGAGGGGENDDGKQYAARFAWVSSRGQLGVSGYHNDTDLAERGIAGIFAGLNTGPVTWLFEYDYVDDQGSADSEQQVALLEANWLVRRGHNLKLTLEGWEFRNGPEDRIRTSLVYEYFPWPFTQLRFGARIRDSDDAAPFLNANEAFVELHAFF